MRRRTFLGVGCAFLAAPLSAKAQAPSKLPRIGLVGSATPEQAQPFIAVFRQRMREHGWNEGEHYALEQRWASGKPDRFADFAADLLRSNVTVIVAWSTPAIMEAKRAMKTIPIVMASSADAVATGFVASLSRPGGNVTGVSLMVSEVSRKHAELLREVLPQLPYMGVLFDPSGAYDMLALRGLESTASSLGIRIEPLEVRTAADLESAFDGLRTKRVGAVFVSASVINWVHRKRIAELAAHTRIPALYPTTEFVKDGGLISYGVNLLDLTRLAADYVNKILRGSAPADLPVEQPTKFELVINAKAAKALGLTIPPSVLLRADQVIE